ncbi:MAG: YraN family protein [Persicimonas sp.]
MEREETAESQEMPDPRRAIGFRGEDLAAEHLREKDWEIIARNYETNLGELDMVARYFERLYGRTEETIAFVEVKTRRTESGPPPEVGVDRRKRTKIVRLAKLFLQREKIRRVNVQFDVVAVDLSGEEPEIVHFEGAFDADAAVW